ncbi:retinal pigment epithelial membrane protein-domain-containing protein [Macrophomina phaseolina]|uniref:Retinal pigment epithelial membrane protein-domain-containing protein n=1 Tax=Macrophomina phaseolina TaxID=35725 RepID=A0ABQ8G5L7_9PEZI|nr:retinal pigment epithelial membrane protein-domain-containing protein [Macrophomina phaseolina]
MGELKDLHKTEIQTSTEAATINVKKKQFPLAEKFQFEQSLPNNSTGIDIPGRFDAELASCVVHGTMPSDIDGTFYRIVCDQIWARRNKVDPNNPRDIWINGDGAVDAWRISNGVVDFKQKFVRTPRFVYERIAREPLFGSYRNIFSGDPRVKDEVQSPGNVHVHFWREKLLIPKDDSPPIIMDPDTLETIGLTDFDGQLNSMSFTSHPKVDVHTGQLLSFGMEANGIGSNDLVYYLFGPDGKKLEECWVKTPYVGWAHDFAFSDNWVVFGILPYETNISWMKNSGEAQFRFNRYLPLVFGILPRRNPKSEDIKWFYGPKNHGWVHFSNHFEKDDKFYFDLFFTDGDGLSSFVDAHPELGPSNPNRMIGKLCRFTIDPYAPPEKNKLERPVVLSHVNGEMARIDDRYVGKPYRHTWGVIWGSGLWDGIVHVDTLTGVSKVWKGGDTVMIHEPCFIPRGPDVPEGDGYLVCVARDKSNEITYLLILDAMDINAGPLCIVEMPLRLHVAAHGNWVSAPLLKTMIAVVLTNEKVNAWDRKVRKPLVDYSGATPELLAKFSTGAPKPYDEVWGNPVVLKYPGKWPFPVHEEAQGYPNGIGI